MSFTTPTVSDLAAWKAQASTGQAPADAFLRKGYTSEIKADDTANRRVSFTISTAEVDRDRDTVAVAGWNLDSYLKNPVVLWCHSYYGLPIARAVSVTPKAKALKAVAEFAPMEMYPLAETVYQMLRGGFLNATSVGFRPLKWVYNEDQGGYEFTEQELLEFSVVPIPANPSALQDAKAAGLSMAPVKAWAEEMLDRLEPGGLWVPKGQLEVAVRALSNPHVCVPAPVTPAPEEKALPTPAPVLHLAQPLMFEVNAETVVAAVVAAVNETARATVDAARGRLP